MPNTKVCIYRCNKNNEDYNFKVIVTNNNIDTIIKKQIEERTECRIFIAGLIDLISSMDKNSTMDVYAPINFGFKYINNQMKGKSVRKWCNKDIGSLLSNKALENNQKFHFYLDNTLVDEKEKIREKSIEKTKQELKVKSEDEVFNCNELADTDVSIYIRGSSDTSDINRVSKYLSILNYKGNEKELYNEFNNSTSSRAILEGAVAAMSLLKFPCNVTIYTHSKLGITNYNKNKKCINEDLLEKLFRIIIENNHSLKLIVSNLRQEQLATKLKNHFLK